MSKILRLRLQKLECSISPERPKRGYCFRVDGQEIWKVRPDKGGRTFYINVKPPLNPLRITRGA